MEFRIEEQPEFAWLTVQVPRDQTLIVEASAMASMDSNIRMRTTMGRGFRRFLSGESLFVNQYTAEGGSGEVCIAPGPSGDIGHYRVSDQPFYLASSNFVAHGPGVEYSTRYQGLLSGFFSGNGLFMAQFRGQGDVWFNSYGALVEIDVKDDLLIDNGHVVAFTHGVEYEISKISGYKSLLFSGEGLACRFRGHGKVWMQTKKPAGLIAWANAFRPSAN